MIVLSKLCGENSKLTISLNCSADELANLQFQFTFYIYLLSQDLPVSGRDLFSCLQAIVFLGSFCHRLFHQIFADYKRGLKTAIKLQTNMAKIILCANEIELKQLGTTCNKDVKLGQAIVDFSD